MVLIAYNKYYSCFCELFISKIVREYASYFVHKSNEITRAVNLIPINSIYLRSPVEHISCCIFARFRNLMKFHR